MNNTQWVFAGDPIYLTDDHTDPFGNSIEPGFHGLGLGGGSVIVEGTLDQLEEFANRIIEAVKEER